MLGSSETSALRSCRRRHTQRPLGKVVCDGRHWSGHMFGPLPWRRSSKPIPPVTSSITIAGAGEEPSFRCEAVRCRCWYTREELRSCGPSSVVPLREV